MGRTVLMFLFTGFRCDELLIMLDRAQSRIKVFNREGHFQYKFGKKGEGDREFNYPHFCQ